MWWLWSLTRDKLYIYHPIQAALHFRQLKFVIRAYPSIVTSHTVYLWMLFEFSRRYQLNRSSLINWCHHMQKDFISAVQDFLSFWIEKKQTKKKEEKHSNLKIEKWMMWWAFFGFGFAEEWTLFLVIQLVVILLLSLPWLIRSLLSYIFLTFSFFCYTC